MAELLNDLIVNGKYCLPSMPKEEKKKALKGLSSFLKTVDKEELQSKMKEESFDLINYLHAQVAIKNKELSKKIDVVIHHPQFTRLEGRWRGLMYLVDNAELDVKLQLKVFCVSDKELMKNLLKSDWDQSQLFKKIYENEIGTFGGNPFSVLAYDFYFTGSSQQISYITKLVSICAAAHCPCIISADSIMFNMDDFRKINQTRDMVKLFQTKVLWNSFRRSEDSRYLSIIVPRVLARAPYSVENNPVENIEYNETVDPNDNSVFVWINAIYILMLRIAMSYTFSGWPVDIRGGEGGLTKGLPFHVYRKPEGDLTIKCPTEVSITDRREKELSELGFIPLCHCKGTPDAAFFSVQTTQLAASYDNLNARASALMSTCFTYILVASRFVHYMKVILRSKIGSFQDKNSIQILLQNWISQYILLNASASQEMKARMPLKDANVDVVEVPGMIGVYNIILRIVPGLQFEEANVSIRLVSNIAMSK